MQRVSLNYNWKFMPEFSELVLDQGYDISKLETVHLPHTCKEVPFHYFDASVYQMQCGYVKEIEVQKEWREKPFLFRVDGAGHTTKLYVNGTFVLEHRCGYTAFEEDISSYLKYGETNRIVLCVDSRESQNIPPFGFVVDYMTFGGLYREVSYEVKEEIYLKDVFLKPQVKVFTGNRKADGILDIELKLEGTKYVKDELENLSVFLQMKAKDGEVVLEKSFENLTKQTLSVDVKEILLWDVESPNLYEVCMTLQKGEYVLDTFISRIGFRTAEFKKDGFYLNGRKFKIRGLNRHQSYPYVGYAVPKHMQQFDAQILKRELGCNAVRTSHYPQSHHFIDACDELGLLVFTEIPGWQHIGDESWKEQAVTNTIDMILQYRNHTSIILWGVRINESIDDEDFYKKTNEVAHEYDPTRPTGGVRCHKKSQLFEDVYTYNDFIHDGITPGCEPKKKVTSDNEKPYLVSEYNGHMFPIKAFDCEDHRKEHAIRHARVLDAVANEEDIAGSFGWCMFDYNTHKDFGSGDRICYHGVMDMYRNPKMASYIYACQQDSEDVLEISSSMDIGEHPGCNRGDTYIFTNADSVKMYKNDVFIKEYKTSDSAFKGLKHGPILIDDYIGNQIIDNEKLKEKVAKEITYALNYTALHGLVNQPLKVKMIIAKVMLFHGLKYKDAVGFFNKYVGDWGGTSTVYRFEAIKDGTVVKSIIKEPAKELNLSLKPSKRYLRNEETYDMLAVRMTVVDQNNNVLPFYQEAVQVSVDGPIELVGPSVVSFKGGMAGIYVKAKVGEEGNAVITFRNPQLKTRTLEISIIK